VPHLDAQEDDNMGVLKLVDHLRRPGVVQKVYVLEPALTCSLLKVRI